eukprot:snap_masked-scaffold_27-processed-gene-2.44-mRNA-1 protein AED:1.00 eAED:1.00 QI:0/-1/0/0/-1/1/1/0/60
MKVAAAADYNNWFNSCVVATQQQFSKEDTGKAYQVTKKLCPTIKSFLVTHKDSAGKRMGT